MYFNSWRRQCSEWWKFAIEQEEEEKAEEDSQCMLGYDMNHNGS